MFTNEFDYEYTFSVDSSMADQSGAVTPWGLQRICVTTVEKHLVNIGVGVTSLMEGFGMSWIMLSLTIKLISPIRFGDKLTLRTKHIYRQGVIYRRDVIFYRDGIEVAYGVTYSSLMDIAARKLSTDRTVPEKLGIPENTEPLFDIKCDSRHKVHPEEFALLETRAVRPSYIDPIGHVNNQRYSEFTHDALPADLVTRLGDLKQLSLYFTGELALGNEFDILTKREGDRVEVLGMRKSDGKQAFCGILDFNKE